MTRTLTVVLAIACVVGMTAWLSRDADSQLRPANSAEEVAYKRAHLAKVLDELAARPVDHLDARQRDRRADVLGALKDYSERGRFPINTEDPDFAVPYFIDAYGTRCALAYAVDRSGQGALVEALSELDNHAYVAHLTDHTGLQGWLRDHGLTIEEAAFIQAPGLIDGWSPPRDTGPQWIESDGEEPMPTDPEERGDANSDPAAPPPTEDSPRSGPERAPRSAGFDRGNWSLWWRINRDAFVSLRERYNGGGTITIGSLRGGSRAGARATKGDVHAKVIPFLMQSAKAKGEVKATAIMAWALASAGDESPAVVDATLDYLRNPESRFRDLLVLSLGIARHPKGTAALLEIAADTRAGRAIFASQKGIPESTRAFAAVALGRTGHRPAVDSLIELLDREKGDRVDLRTAAITALGELARTGEHADREKIARYLGSQLKRGRWADRVLASIPAAMVKTGNAEAIESVRRIVARFRGPREVRESCALALGGVATMTPDLLDALIAAARRDPDLQTRRFAAIAIGELCVRAKSEELTPAMETRLRRFYTGTLEGHIKQPNTLEWHYFSAGLFARACPKSGERIVDRLIRVAERSKKTSERSSAILALGLSDDKRSIPAVRGRVRRCEGRRGARQLRRGARPARRQVRARRPAEDRAQRRIGHGALPGRARSRLPRRPRRGRQARR